MFPSLLVAALASSPAQAWGHHYLVTDRALQHPGMAWTAARVQVESIDSLLAAEGPAISRALDDHYAWLAMQDSERFRRQVLDPDHADRAAFLHAARLNPGAHLPLVVRRLPGADAPGFPVDSTAASPYLVYKEPLLADVHVVTEGEQISARDVLLTYSDEPDWGMDHELWGYTDYGYGEQPFGKPTGESSKAPFHMQFDHENFLTRAVTDLDECMVPHRIDLFLRLSRAAFQTGHDYWGLRFAAWAVHYGQDLAQPYHSRAVPSARFAWYLGYLFSGKKEAIEAETTQLSANRHFVYEDFVAYGLQQSYLDVDDAAEAALYAQLAAFLAADPLALSLKKDSLGAGTSAPTLVAALTGPAAAHAWTIDQALASSFPDHLMHDPAYDVETAPDYSIARVLPQVSAEARATLLAETGQDFAQAGAATRSILLAVGAEAALAD